MSKRSVPSQPPKTKTLPESMRVPYFEGPDLVTALRVFGSGVEFPLPREQKTFTLGSSSDRDIALPAGYLSQLHCVLERRPSVLRVVDQNSHNGTIFEGRREASFELRPGSTFVAGPFTFLAVNDEMRRAYPTLAGILGPEDDQSLQPPVTADAIPSAMMVLATSGQHVLIVAEPGCEQAKLARVMHDMSRVRARPPVSLTTLPADRGAQRELLDAASRSTLLLEIDSSSEVMDAAFVSSIFGSSFRIRVIATAPTVEKARAVLTADHVHKMRIVELPALAFRTSLPALLDHVLAERGASVRFSQLTEENQAALRGYGWPGNFDDLRFVAERLDAMAHSPSMRQAAASLGLANTSLRDWAETLGLSHPVVAAQEKPRR
jgi:hypothetical protein